MASRLLFVLAGCVSGCAECWCLQLVIRNLIVTTVIGFVNHKESDFRSEAGSKLASRSPRLRARLCTQIVRSSLPSHPCLCPLSVSCVSLRHSVLCVTCIPLRLSVCLSWSCQRRRSRRRRRPARRRTCSTPSSCWKTPASVWCPAPGSASGPAPTTSGTAGNYLRSPPRPGVSEVVTSRT